MAGLDAHGWPPAHEFAVPKLADTHTSQEDLLTRESNKKELVLPHWFGTNANPAAELSATLHGPGTSQALGEVPNP